MSNPVAALDSLLEAQSNLTASFDGESQRESLVTTRRQLKNKNVRFNEQIKQYIPPKTGAVAEPLTIHSSRVREHESNKPKISTALEQQTIRDAAPILYATATSIQSALPQRSFTVLLDSGSTNTLIKKSSLPYGAIPAIGRTKRTTTTMGSFDSSSTVCS